MLVRIRKDVRAVLQSHGNSIAVNTTHEQSKERTNSQKLLEGNAVDGGDLQQT